MQTIKRPLESAIVLAGDFSAGSFSGIGRRFAAFGGPAASEPWRNPPPAAVQQAARARVRAEDPLAALVAGMQRGEEGALDALFDATVSRVFAVALRIVRRHDAAEDVVSDVYFQVWNDARRFDAERGSVMAWLLVIARSRALDALRRADPAASHADPYEAAGAGELQAAQCGDPLDILAAARSDAALHRALDTLKPAQRQLLALAFFRGYSHAEIASHARLPLGSVKTQIRCAMMALRKLLGDDAHAAGELL